MKKVLLICGALLAMLMTACNECSNHKEVPIDTTSYLNYDEIVVQDYDYVASQVEQFYFYEAEVEFDSTLNTGTTNIVAITNIFQIEDTCYQFIHTTDMDTLIKVQGYWMECGDMTARNAIMFDDVMEIISPYRDKLNTRYMTLRRLLCPPFPTTPWYIFGRQLLAIDAATGEII